VRLEAAPAGTRSRATSKSAVSRRRLAATRTQLAAQLGRRLDELNLVALFLDGVHVAGQTLIVALGVAVDGSKSPLGIRLGSTENAAICTELLQDLVTRGGASDEQVLCVIDGGKGLRKTLEDVLGTGAVIQRCQLHKERNLLALIPPRRQPFVRVALRRAYRAASAAVARRQLQILTSWLESNGHPDAAASLPRTAGGDADGVQARPAASAAPLLRTTNCIENLIATLRHVPRNVTRRRHDSPLGGPRPAPRRRPFPTHQAPSRAAAPRARPAARDDRGRGGVSRFDRLRPEGDRRISLRSGHRNGAAMVGAPGNRRELKVHRPDRRAMMRCRRTQPKFNSRHDTPRPPQFQK
jgi:Transposase, Mutator family